ncbi:MAG: hypothetical protein HYS06_09960 [Methylocystis sp.]|nr:hypothetical protein [Methylocystis sp.]
MRPAIFSRSVALFSIFVLAASSACDLRARFGAQLAIASGVLAAPSRAEAQNPTPKSAGQFSENDLPANRDSAVLLTVPAPGRYAVRARSASGVAIQLVDMIAGPSEIAGAAGLRDGRLDLLLDKGVYKLRVFGAKGAAGKVKLSAEPFQELETQRTSLAPGQKYGGELGDLAQRSYFVDVGPAGQLAVEAVGRVLQDLRLWRVGGELVDLAPQKRTIEPKPGHSASRLRLEGAVEPGRYVATAYGGEPLVWPEGSAAQPFLLRLVAPSSLAAGVVEGVIGPFGSARFEAPASYDAFLLELPQPVTARLEAKRGRAATSSATIAKTNREPIAVVTAPANGKDPAIVEVSGFEGQTFQLRALRSASRLTFEGSGPHLVAVDVAGEGEDEIPATALLARMEKDATRVIAADAPRIAPGRAWRRKFNLRGPSSLLFEATASGPIAIATQGPRVRAAIEPVFGSLAPRADGRQPTQYDLQAGFYVLSLEPIDGAVGVLDVTLGQPGLVPEIAPPAPPRSILSFGEQPIDKSASYAIIVNSAPNSLLTGPRTIALPADLEQAPLPLWQEAAAEISVPVRAPQAGKLVAHDAKGANVPLTLADERLENNLRFATLRIQATGQARALGVVFVADATAPPPEENAREAIRERSLPTIAVSRPHFFDLARNERREFRFDAPQGGLYRIETLGRLQTSLAVGTNVSPRFGEASGNGPGHNGLATTYLRAGSYRVAVSANESAGHLGLSVTPAALQTTAKLSSEGSARASLAGGRGAIVPIEIANDGLYRIDLQGLGRQWRARLEDADGWPLTTPGKLTRLVRRFEKGGYRLVVLPEDVEARMVARLRPIAKPSALEGHGPHPLPFERAQKLQWREPQAKGAPRTPDVWRFSLQGDADVEIDISEGMIAELIKNGGDNVGKFAAGRKFAGKLGPGDYAVEARSLAHDDRLDYEVSLTAKELQPGAPRFVDLPATLAFATSADRIVDLTSFGDRELVGVLKDANGAVVEWLEGRADDWNIALSRRLPAGRYTLELNELSGKPGSAGQPVESAESSEDGETSPSEEASQAASDAQAAEAAETADEAVAARDARRRRQRAVRF